jgi:hypothetical protein
MPNPTPNLVPQRTGTLCLDCAAVLYTGPGSGALVDGWGERTCSASYRDHAADLPAVVGENMSGRLRRAAASCRTDLTVGLNPVGAGALAAAPPPHQGRSASSASLRDRPRAALDTGDPAHPLPDAVRAGATNAPARP